MREAVGDCGVNVQMGEQCAELGAIRMTVIPSDLKLFLFNLLLLRRSSCLLHGEFSRNGHDAVVCVEHVGSDLVQLEGRKHKQISLYLHPDTEQKYTF